MEFKARRDSYASEMRANSLKINKNMSTNGQSKAITINQHIGMVNQHAGITNQRNMELSKHKLNLQQQHLHLEGYITNATNRISTDTNRDFESTIYNAETTKTQTSHSKHIQQLDDSKSLVQLNNSVDILEDYIDDVDYKLKTNLIRLKAIVPRRVKGWSLEGPEKYDEVRHKFDVINYRYQNLNNQQKIIYDHVMNNPNQIIVVQAGPGCGKSFVLKSIAYHQKRDVETIIYKNDLLAAFRYNSRRWSVTRFIMEIMDMNYFAYAALDKLLSSSMDSYQFILVIISMLKKAELTDLAQSLIFLDEYTVMAKPFLLVMLILFEHYKIGTIVCGDRNQLQNIYNSRHTSLSSYSMAETFAQKVFNLEKNERCENFEYNLKIDLFAKFSSDRQLDDYAYAMVSAFFLRQIIEPPNYMHVHLAANHQELSDLAHIMVCNNKYDVSFYDIDQSRIKGRDLKNNISSRCQTEATKIYMDKIKQQGAPTVGKFLPYLPLVIGGRYFVEHHSEYNQGTLMSYDAKCNMVTMKLDNGEEMKYTKQSTHDEVLFDQHKLFLLNTSRGKIHNYPIYPSNFMTIHKCQGCTITGKLNLILNHTTYQGLYVALSRVKSPEQIARISVPNQTSHLISTIINFPQYCENRIPTVEEVTSKMVNYVFYDITRTSSDNKSDIIRRFSMLAVDFILSTDSVTKQQIREIIIKEASNTYKCHQRILIKQHDDERQDPNMITMSKIIKYREIILALSRINEIDRNVWLHEYLLNNLDLVSLLPENFKRDSNTMENFRPTTPNVMMELSGLNKAYYMDISSKLYIESIAKINVRFDIKDQELHKKYLMKVVDNNVFMETSEFCAKVYQKYINNEKCTENWLIYQLNYMLSQIKDSDSIDDDRSSWLYGKLGRSNLKSNDAPNISIMTSTPTSMPTKTLLEDSAKITSTTTTTTMSPIKISSMCNNSKLTNSKNNSLSMQQQSLNLNNPISDSACEKYKSQSMLKKRSADTTEIFKVIRRNKINKLM